MKKIFFLASFAALFLTANAQDAATLHQTAKNFMRTGDYDNALLVLNRALESQPGDMSILKDEAFVYYLQKDYANAIKTGNLIVTKPEADVQAFQVLGLSYRAIAEYKEGDKMYSEGLKKFPTSGVLHNDYGEMQHEEHLNSGAIREWELGIATDPNFSGNYYNAASYYNITGNILWAILYGEIFINIESLSDRTSEIKDELLSNYKKLYSGTYLSNLLVKGKPFEKAVATIFNNNKSVTSIGMTPESLTQLRTRFILMWGTKYAVQFPYHLFDFQKMLLQQGSFEAYNQWIFGAVANSSVYDSWVDAHADEVKTFQHYQQNVLYKSPLGEYYAH